MKKKISVIIASVSMIIFSLILYKYFYPAFNPYYGINPKISNNNILSKAKNTLKNLNFENTDFIIESSIHANKALIKQTQMTYGINKANSLLRDSVTGYFWELRVKTSNLPLKGFSNNDDKLVKNLFGEIRLKFDLSGRLIAYEHNLPDSLKLTVISFSEAYKLANDFLRNFTDYKKLIIDTLNMSTDEKENSSNTLTFSTNNDEELKTNNSSNKTQTHYKFSAVTYSKPLNNKIILNIGVTGNIISSFTLNEKIPSKFENDVNFFVDEIIISIAYFILIIIMIVVAFRRYRAYEMGFGLSWIIGIIGGLSVSIAILTSSQSIGWEILLPAGLSFVFVSGGILLVWAVSESLTREIWKEKIFTLDLIYNGYFVHSTIGKGLLRGLGFGFAILSLSLLLLAVVNLFWEISIIPFTDELTLFNNNLHLFYALTKAINQFLFQSIVLLLFLGSIIKNRIKNKYLVVIVMSVIWGLIISSGISPFYVGFIVNFFIGILVSSIFFRYDYLTTITSLLVFSVLNVLISLFYQTSNITGITIYIYIAILILLFVFAIFALFSKRYIDNFEAITPAFARHISERQRMQSELQVAREVQMSFLPQKSPNFNGINISAKCIPAYEVGGDYYDFITINNKRFGVAIGDVSGKGTKAAFYMTLTKGFLKATSRFFYTPASILTGMNSMFFENVERGSFISMIYADIDMENKTLVFARAGHNPLIVKKYDSNEVNVYKPNGIALGLEKGDIFGKTITEQSIKFNSGDIFVFYTDGITEAENNKKEEYGENRLLNVIKNTASISAQEILDSIFSEVQKFTGKTAQHDDMTVIVLTID